ncbi:peptidase S1 [Pilimelia anulata]|uniref:Peptidase S1 n=1 Tax=Pilimelia anulata TaxID=53371 RepID=A0A8J3FBF2_9ACTN|nr:trypsin-like peptidase domain-containing protein [Pilimelia anulata]GGK01598.1 peptidase S1 [Pilimelia anulata]
MTDHDAPHGETHRTEPLRPPGTPEPARAPVPHPAGVTAETPPVPAGVGTPADRPGGQPGAYPQATWTSPSGYQPAYDRPAAPTEPHISTAGGYPAGAAPWLQGTGAQPTVEQPAPNRKRGRTGLVVGLGVGAIALALCSGVAGAAITHAMSDDGPVTTLDRAGNGAPAAVLNRDSLAGIADGVTPSVVAISTGQGEGSGVVMSADGFVVTNNHVIAAAGTNGRVSVAFKDGRTLPGTVVGTDPRTDLGVVKVAATDLKPAKFGDSSGMRVGDTVMAIGSPLGLQGSVTAGIVSFMNRTIQAGGGENESPFGSPAQGQTLSGLMQTDAPINPGNSGGALVNLNGEVIGINTAIATAGSQGNIGVGFAIPSNRAKTVAEQIKSGQKVSHPYIGVNLTDAESGGALITAVAPTSPAAKAGLQKGDIITEFGGRKIGKADDLVSAVQAGKVSDKLAVSYTRSGTAAKTTVTLGESN